ncbi:MAG: S8/S53 family peptidase [Chloroflexi bacterium]|nr:S8/S53 family peptidase [Chloroflexota bacterium]MBV9897400.1 S8/S53 family peptidase [Chloroflexota bacterium]
MQTPPEDPNEQHVVNYVPDEISVVISTEGIQDPAAFYEHVRSRLNRQITALLKAAASGDQPIPGPLGADLSPVVLVQRFGGDRAVLQPLRRAKPRPTDQTAGEGPASSSPWISLRNGRAHHLYFGLGRDPVPVGKMDVQRLHLGLESVRELVLLLNRFARTDAEEATQWKIRAIAPNWLTVAYQFACGCPAGLPLPVESQRHRWRFHFRGPLLKAMDEPARAEVLVAVLDTCPTQVAVDSATLRFPGNTLLSEVHKDVPMDSPKLAPTGFAAHLEGCLPRLQWDMQNGPVHTQPDQFAMADHGLFVAGVVHDVLAGRGRVHLIRILNDYGIGDLFAITHALAVLPSLLLQSESTRLVINLSLGIDLPIPARLLDRWLPQVAGNVKALRERGPEVAELLDLLHANLRDVVDGLTERGILVVAATGNDALRLDVDPGDPPPPRFPARYDDVLGVAATRRDLHTASDFSNRGELAAPAWPGDVSTFGGSVVAASAPDQPATTDPVDNLVGIFSGPSLPGGAPNASGWVRWAGTSFSTPVVAGAAARLWATRPELGPQEVIAWLRSFAHHPRTGPDPDAPLEVPVLDVTQR